jgi:DNA polymerase, archaea type
MSSKATIIPPSSRSRSKIPTKGIDSDFVVYNARCIHNDVSSIVDISSFGKPYLKRHLHIDLANVYGKQIVMNDLCRRKYRTSGLNEVSLAMLGPSVGGKYQHLSGADLRNLSISEQKKYNLRDVELTKLLAEHNDYKILTIMKNISAKINMPYDKVCSSASTKWWEKILDDIPAEAFNPNASKRMLKNITGKKYKGGLNLEPRIGYFENIYIMDAVSMYPSISINLNISHDTVNCKCCKSDADAQVSPEITKDCIFATKYWICQKHKGVFSERLKEFKADRLAEKAAGDVLAEKATKTVMNSGYGSYGAKYFNGKYRDFRTAELITAYGRHILSKMTEIAKEMDIDIIYGDTDSVFVDISNIDKRFEDDQSILKRFQDKCNNIFEGIDIDVKDKLVKLVLVAGKHYVAITDKGELIIKGMEGIKNDRPKFVRNTFAQVVQDIFVADIDPLPNLASVIEKLESNQIPIELLMSSQRLSKDPSKYKNPNERKRIIGEKHNLRKGDIAYFYESNNKAGWVDIDEPEKLSIDKIKKILYQTIVEVCRFTGNSIGQLKLIPEDKPKQKVIKLDGT